MPPMTLSLKRSMNVPRRFFTRRDFSLALVTKPMMCLQRRERCHCQYETGLSHPSLVDIWNIPISPQVFKVGLNQCHNAIKPQPQSDREVLLGQ